MRDSQPRPDPLQAVTSGHDPVRGRVQRVPQNLLVLCVRAAHASRSSTTRSADMARAVWLLTAPRLMPIVVAIWASDRSP